MRLCLISFAISLWLKKLLETSNFIVRKIYLMQKIILFFLRIIARMIIIVHKPYVIGITGTVWKTTMTAHVSSLLESHFPWDVWYSPYHYNGEYGLPLSIIWVKTPGSNPILWIWVFIVWIFRLFQKYPKYLVLEYWIDHPNEMDFLLSIAIPDIAIITEVFPNHIEQFLTFEAYRAEKLKMTKDSKFLILHDSLRPFVDREAIYFWLWAMSDVDASHIEVDTNGTRATVHAFWKDFPVSVKAFWAFHIENLLPLYVISDILKFPSESIEAYAKKYTPESGRSTILSWIWGSTIVDGSYNGWFLSMRWWIVSMRSFVPAHRIILFLGDMRELGEESARIHEELAHEIISLFPHDSSVSCFLVGPLMQTYVAPIIWKYFQTETSLSSRILGKKIADFVQESSKIPTMIYVKWSQNTIFLEEGIKYFLANASDEKLLCRQTPEWLIKKEKFYRTF